MTSLHLLNQSSSHAAFSECLAALGSAGSLLLLDDAVLELQRDTSPLWALEGVKLYALDADLDARGVSPTKPITSINYSEFVTLTAQHCPVISWY